MPVMPPNHERPFAEMRKAIPLEPFQTLGPFRPLRRGIESRPSCQDMAPEPQPVVKVLLPAAAFRPPAPKPVLVSLRGDQTASMSELEMP